VTTEDDRAAQLRRSWNANAAAWTESVREQKIESRRVATDAAVIEAVLALQPRSVLDLGCGEGWLTRALATRGINATGVDASHELIEDARKLGGGSFHALAYDELTTIGETFDVIVANFSLLDERLPLAALHALLREGGALVIQTVHPTAIGTEEGWRVENFAAFEGEWPEPMPWYFRTRDSWTAALRAGGFVVEEVREPRHPETGKPLSLIFVSERRRPGG
jgi:2-polyprenyl-3-methyl-5-hydroxy-6-metoxy-1,4-benzoquinol methylase